MNFQRLIKILNEPTSVIVSIFSLIGIAYSAYLGYTKWRNDCNLNGSWQFTFYIESSTLNSAVGQSAEYQIFISHTNEEVTGNGEKRKVNGAVIPTAQHDRLTFKGSVEEKKVSVTYTLYGSRRTTDGTFTVKVIDEKTMEGTFAGTAANTKGRVVAIKSS